MYKIFLKICIGICFCIMICGATVNAKNKDEIIQGNVLVEYSGKAKEYIVPKEVKVIRANAFAKAKNLKKITIHKNVKKINISSRKGLYAPKLEKLVVAKKNKKYASYKGCLYSKDMKCLKEVPYCMEKLEISDKCTDMSDGSLSGCPKLKSLRIGKQLNYIEDGEFITTNLPKLEKIEVSKGNKTLFVDKGVLYKKLDNGVELYYLPEALKCSERYVVEEYVTEINRISLNPYIKQLVIPKNVKSIHMESVLLKNLEELIVDNNGNEGYLWGAFAFSACSGLKKIVFTDDCVEMPAIIINQTIKGIRGHKSWGDDVVICSRINSTSHKYAVENNLKWCELNVE